MKMLSIVGSLGVKQCLQEGWPLCFSLEVLYSNHKNENFWWTKISVTVLCTTTANKHMD